VDRRAFLRSSGLVAGGTLLGAGGGSAVAEYSSHQHESLAGHAVGADRPPKLGATTIAYRAACSEPLIALTFDDGPSTKYTSHVLDILDAKDVTATFFVIGKHAARFPALVRRAAQRHEIGNHTWSHHHLSTGRARPVTRELQRTEQEIRGITGRAPVAFRPPYGCFSGAAAMAAVGMQYSIVLWDVKYNTQDSAASNLARIATNASRGSIILAHDGGTLNNDVVVETLPSLIDRLRQRGLRFVTVSHLLRSAADEAAAAPRSDDVGT